MSKHTNTTRRIGNVWVDSGQLMLGDPCYLHEWAGHEFASDRPGEYSYAGACTATLSDESAGIIGGDSRGRFEGRAAVFTSGYGDGSYPVEATYNGEGRIVSVTVVFDDLSAPVDECEVCGDEAEAGTLHSGMCEACLEVEEEAAAQDGGDEG